MLTGTTYSEETDYQDTLDKYYKLGENFVYYHYPNYDKLSELSDSEIKKYSKRCEKMRQSPTIIAYLEIFSDVLLKRRVNKLNKLL